MHEMVVSSRSLGCPVSRKLFSIPRMMWSASIDVAKPEAATFAPSFINPATSCCSMIFMVMSLSFCSCIMFYGGCGFCDRATKDGPQALPQVRFHCMQNIGLLLPIPESSPAELTVRAGLPARRIRPFRLPGRFDTQRSSGISERTLRLRRRVRAGFSPDFPLGAFATRIVYVSFLGLEYISAHE